MLVAIGPGAVALQHYPNVHYDKVNINSQQGNVLDQLTLSIWDPTSSSTIVNEDDIVVLNEFDPNGWPTLNLLQNPSFEGTYSSGVAPNWSKSTNNTVGTATFTASATALYSSESQSISVSNIDSGKFAIVQQQNVAIPVDENNNPIIALPFSISCAYLVTAAFTNANLQLLVNWKDSNRNFLATGSNRANIVNPGLSSGWQRMSVTNTAPAGAIYADFILQIITSNATNSGTVLLDGAQWEYCTFANYRSQQFPVGGLLNTSFANHGVSGAGSTCDYWAPRGTQAGLTLSVVAGGGQNVSWSNTAANGSTHGIQQDALVYNPKQNYMVSCTIAVTAACDSNSVAQIGIKFEAANGSTLLDVHSTTVPGSSLSTVGQIVTIGFRIGPQTSNVPPANTAALQCYIGMNNGVSSTNSGGFTITAVAITPDDARLQPQGSDTTALAGGMYPTPFVDPALAGVSGSVYQDRGYSGCYYRHLRMFGGYVRIADFDYTQMGGFEADISINAVDYTVLLQESPANITFKNVTDLQAITQSFAAAVARGFLVGVDYATFVSHIATINSYTFAWRTLRDLMNSIADQTLGAYWIDYNKYLHYGSALTNTLPFAVSDHPDLATTFPMSGFKVTKDTSQAISQIVVEGQTQESATQTFTDHTSQTTISGSGTVLFNGNTYTSIPVAATPQVLTAGTILQLGSVGAGLQVVVSATVGAGATSISVQQFTADQNYAAGTTVSTIGYTVNGYNPNIGGNPITQVYLAQIGATQYTVGNQQSQANQGYQVLFDGPSSQVIWQALPAFNQAVTITFTLNVPVIAQVYETGSGSAGSLSLARLIFEHDQFDTVVSLQTATDRGQAELIQRAKPRPIGQIVLNSPPWPVGVPLRAGQAIAVTFAPLKYTAQLYQIQQCKISSLGLSGFKYTLMLGFYIPDAMQQAAAALRGINVGDLISNTVLNDVLSVADGWTLTDNAFPVLSNVGIWASGPNPAPGYGGSDLGRGIEALGVSGVTTFSPFISDRGVGFDSVVDSPSTWNGTFVWGQ